MIDESQKGSESAGGAPVEFRQCPSCGTFGYAGDRFCAHCGAGLPPGCARCGAPSTHPIAFYCTACGAELRVGMAENHTPSRNDTIKGES